MCLGRQWELELVACWTGSVTAPAGCNLCVSVLHAATKASRWPLRSSHVSSTCMCSSYERCAVEIYSRCIHSIAAAVMSDG